jgi:tetratricopeptide (TPR) repeat protein
VYVQAAVFEDCGDVAKAERLYSRALTSLQLIYKRHPHVSVAITLNNYANVLKMRGEYKKALTYYAEAEDMILVLNGGDAGITEVATIKKNKAQCLRALGKHTEAAALCESALELFEATVGPSDPEYSSCMNTAGLAYMQAGDLDKARSVCERASEIRTDLFGSVHPSYAVVGSNTAVLYLLQSEPPTAGPILARCVKIGETMVSAACADVRTALTNLSAVYIAQGNTEDAQPLLKAAEAVHQVIDDNAKRNHEQWSKDFGDKLHSM